MHMASGLNTGCTVQTPISTRDPSLEFLRRNHIAQKKTDDFFQQQHQHPQDSSSPRARYASSEGELNKEEAFFERSIDNTPAIVPDSPPGKYTGPLVIGDPGVNSSLWRESAGSMNDLFHDYRAWQPMDLLTIVINERAQGNKQANTRVNKISSFEAAVRRFIGVEASIAGRNTQLSPASLIDAETGSEFTGQGQTLRQDLLTGTISAMVTEVLPSGILRIEGEKIITVNGEEQTMRLTGLVRPRDVSSNNEVRSNQIANVRIDYFGRGSLGDTQEPGWIIKVLHLLWPF